jgi:DNA-binding transcriptional LysR family regulator
MRLAQLRQADLNLLKSPQFEFLPWQSGIAELVEHGQVDLVLHIDDGLLPSHFQSESLYREDWICAVARGSRFGDRLSLEQYLTTSHIDVSTYAGVQTIPDSSWRLSVPKRSSCIRVLHSVWPCNAFPEQNSC